MDRFSRVLLRMLLTLYRVPERVTALNHAETALRSHSSSPGLRSDRPTSFYDKQPVSPLPAHLRFESLVLEGLSS
jgi:hypothetical protein